MFSCPGRWPALAVCLALALGACSGSDRPDGAGPSPSAAPAARDATPGPEAEAGDVTGKTLWLCRPGLRDNPCEGDLDTTVVAADGSRSTERFRAAADPSFDCFYVYPTVSTASSTNAPLRVAPELVRAARSQAALFGRECRVFAPVYRQITLQGLITGGFLDSEARATAHADVVAAWREYLDRWNDGRPFLLLGHSQGTFELTALLDEEIDDDPALRERLVSAMLLGGSVTVAEGEQAGGSFDNVPACRERSQTGCVVAYNTFPRMPPEGSLFGRAGEGRQALCVNPAAPAGGPAPLTPYVPEESAGEVVGFTAYEGSVTGACRRGGGASWLQVRAGGALPAGVTAESFGPAWGLHQIDVNVALGDLVDLAADQAAALR